MKEAYGRINLETIRELSEAHGISGYEKEVSHIMKEWLTPVCDEITYDNSGSVTGLQKGSADGPGVMICGHVGEVGFMVHKIDEQGYTRMLPIDGWWGRALPSQTLYVTTEEGRQYHGVVGFYAPHGLPPKIKEKVTKPLDLSLDMGVDNREEILELGIQIGDMITSDTRFKVMNSPNYLTGKAWGDRLCAALAVDVLHRTQKIVHETNAYAVGIVQGEIGLRGVRTAADLLHSDVVITLDVTTTLDTPMDRGDVRPGNSVVPSIMDTGIIARKALLRETGEICRDLGLSINYDMTTAGGTDADNTHKAYDGIITMILSIPTCHMHFYHLTIHRRNHVQTVEAIAGFCRRLSRDKVGAMRTTAQ